MTDFKNKTKGKVLIIEDSLVTLEIIAEMIESFGLKVRKEYDEISAIEAFKKENFKLVITDINLNKIGGIELARRLKKIDNKIKIIGITGSTREIKTDYIDKVIEKPIKKKDLYVEIDTELEGVNEQFSKIINTKKNKKFIGLMEKFRKVELTKAITFLKNNEKQNYDKIIHKISGSLKFWGNDKTKKIIYNIQTKKYNKNQKIRNLKILDKEIKKEIKNLIKN
ncbi:MAG: response regulator [Fusobacteriota bacterium]